jgi:hypothetical protein
VPEYWLATLAFLLIVHPLVARLTRWGTAVAGAAVFGFLGWVDLVLTAVVAVPLVAGVLANRRAVAARAAGMSAVTAVLDRVGVGTTQLISTGLISTGRSERVRQDHLATVDRFHDVFTAHTRRVGMVVAWAEIAFSPVTILAVTLSAGMVLVTPRADMLAFLLLGPVAGDCVAKVTQHQPPGPRPPLTTDTHANIPTTLGRLRSVVAPGSDMRQAAIAAIITALVHGMSLAVAITVVRLLFDQSSRPWLPLFSLLALSLVHTLALRWSSTSAQGAGIAVLRQLSYRIIDRILTAPEGSLTRYKDQLPRLVTRDVVTISGLPVHALRSFVSAVLMPVTAMLTLMMIEWRLGISALPLVPLVALAVFALLRQPRRELRSARAATNRIFAFLGTSRGVSLPGIEK